MPEINLLPMMDVIMTILTFFIIVSMTLTSFQAVDVSLPQSKDGKTTEKPANPLIVGLNQQGQLLLEGKTAPRDRLAQHIAAYLNATPDGTVVLKADKQLPYERVVQVLGTLRDMGGDRVSLAIE
ncbi:biopolymer transporter ExbD [Myxacorys almedinensis A]|uniref:Biopolymer transporter ExbD n=2 Tax=Myxacorys TaxID=2056239 RepID=A0A8J7Z945_9CYAN|nr:biopolymer transporter ExbD [Myxacorys almedinensis A]